MSYRASILKEFNKEANGTVISVSNLYREKFANEISELAFLRMISRLNESGEIVRVSKGMYCKPIQSRYGVVLPSENEIAKDYLKGTKGMLVGYGLYNSLGITTQVSKRKELYSSAIKAQTKQIGNVFIKKVSLKYTEDIIAIVQLMELLHHYREIQDVNYREMIGCFEQLSQHYNDKSFDLVQKELHYPKWVIASLREVLNYYNVQNKLDSYLSTFSAYKVPNMEELNETIITKR